jgi:hypothetical protein
MAYVFEARILLCLLSHVIQPYAWVLCRNMTRENKKHVTSMEPTNYLHGTVLLRKQTVASLAKRVQKFILNK